MILIKVRGFRGIDAADVECAPIALVAGANYQAKTSFCQAAGAALTGDTLAGLEIKMADAPALVHRGQDQAMAEVLNGEGGRVLMSWPKCQGSCSGEAPPRASSFAAGLKSLPGLPPVERARVLQEYLHTSPTKEDLVGMLQEHFQPVALDKLWELIERDGWDRVHEDQIQRRRDLGRDWSRVAGENFGSEKSRAWSPEGWDPLLLEIGRDDLAAKVAVEERALEEAIGQIAVSHAERERLQMLAGRSATLPAQIEQLRQTIQDSETEITAAQQTIANNPDPSPGIACPHCGGFLDVRTYADGKVSILPNPTLSGAELKARRTARAEAAGTLSRLEIERSNLKSNLAALERGLEEATEAANQLTTVTETPTDPERARARVAEAKAALALFDKYTEARRLYRLWSLANIAIGVLAPEGLRKKKLSEAIEKFNQQLAALAAAAGWPAVRLSEDLAVFYAGTEPGIWQPFALISESEQFRARAVLQIAMALIDKSSLIIIDRADLLDAKGKNGLIMLLKHAGIAAVVGMTISRREQVPDLAKAGLGKSYWMEGGRLAA